MRARHRAAASDVCGRSRLREHARRRRTRFATSSHPTARTASASRSTSITSGGTRSCRPQIVRAGERDAALRLSHLRLARADARPAERPRHDGRRRHRPAADPRRGWKRPATAACTRSRSSRRELVEARRRRGPADVPPAARRRKLASGKKPRRLRPGFDETTAQGVSRASSRSSGARDPGVRVKVHVLRLVQEQEADDRGHQRDDDRIPQAVVDVAASPRPSRSRAAAACRRTSRCRCDTAATSTCSGCASGTARPGTRRSARTPSSRRSP